MRKNTVGHRISGPHGVASRCPRRSILSETVLNEHAANENPYELLISKIKEEIPKFTFWAHGPTWADSQGGPTVVKSL